MAISRVQTPQNEQMKQRRLGVPVPRLQSVLWAAGSTKAVNIDIRDIFEVIWMLR